MSGKLFVLTGPSGVGKGILISRLLKQNDIFGYSVSATTRKPRSGEVEGKHYFFLSEDQFQKRINDGDFLEWAEFSGYKYGTLRSEVQAKLHLGLNVVLEIEVQGARQVKKQIPQAILIFVKPPNLEELQRRLIERGSESESQITKRLKIAESEILAEKEFDFILINDDLEASFDRLLKYCHSVLD